MVSLVNQADLRGGALDISASIWHIRGATGALPTFFLKAFRCAPISIHQVPIIALNHPEVEAVPANLNAPRIVRIRVLRHSWLVLACQTSVVLELMGRPACDTVEAGHPLTGQARRIAIIASKRRLHRSVLRVHALEECALTIIQLIWAVDACSTEIPGGARRAYGFAGLTTFLEVVWVETARALHHASETIVIIAETCLRVFSACVTLIVFRTITRQTLFIARHTSTIDDELTLLALGDTK